MRKGRGEREKKRRVVSGSRVGGDESEWRYSKMGRVVRGRWQIGSDPGSVFGRVRVVEFRDSLGLVWCFNTINFWCGIRLILISGPQRREV